MVGPKGSDHIKNRPPPGEEQPEKGKEQEEISVKKARVQPASKGPMFLRQWSQAQNSDNTPISHQPGWHSGPTQRR